MEFVLGFEICFRQKEHVKEYFIFDEIGENPKVETILKVNDFIDDFGGIYINTDSNKLNKVSRDYFVERVNAYEEL